MSYVIILTFYLIILTWFVCRMWCQWASIHKPEVGISKCIFCSFCNTNRVKRSNEFMKHNGTSLFIYLQIMCYKIWMFFSLQLSLYWILNFFQKFIKPWKLCEDKYGCIPQTLTVWHAQNERMTFMYTHIQQGASVLVTFTLIWRIYVSMPCFLSIGIDLFTSAKVLENWNLQQ